MSTYLDAGLAAEARQILDSFPSDQSCLFAYSRALIQFISWRLLGEDAEGTSAADAEAALAVALASNPHVAVFLGTGRMFEQFGELAAHSSPSATPLLF